MLKLLVIQQVRIYEKYESCANNVMPLRVKMPFTPKERAMVELEKQKYLNQHGKITTRLLVYWNKAKYNTRAFKYKLDWQGGIYEQEKNRT